jgi:hypothetical protein
MNVMQKYEKLILCVLVTLSVCFLISLKGWGQSSGGYAGWRACMACHAAKVKSWKETPHAKAFESLRKTNQEKIPGCVSCHVTAFEEPDGFIDVELTPELTDVQCEECHGPAKKHVGNMMIREGMVAKPDERKCKKCHTAGQDPRFNYNEKRKSVHP